MNPLQRKFFIADDFVATHHDAFSDASSSDNEGQPLAKTDVLQP